MLGADVRVHRNDAITVPRRIALEPDAPVHLARPRHAGRCGRFHGHDPRASPDGSRCSASASGHQAIVEVFGGKVVRARAADARQDLAASSTTARACSPGCRSRCEVGRYHSLIAAAGQLPEVARSHGDDAAKARSWACGIAARVEGVQFHPESILTPEGPRLLAELPGWSCAMSPLREHARAPARAARPRRGAGGGPADAR